MRKYHKPTLTCYGILCALTFSTNHKKTDTQLQRDIDYLDNQA